MAKVFPNPENRERATTLAKAMYEHLCDAQIEGLPFADMAAALSLTNAMFLSIYDQQVDREEAAQKMAQTALKHASHLDGLERGPHGHA